MSVLDFPLSTGFCLHLTYVRTWPSSSSCYVFLLFARRGKKGYASTWLASVMSFYLLHGEKGVVCSICLYLAFPVVSFYFLQGD